MHHRRIGALARPFVTPEHRTVPRVLAASHCFFYYPRQRLRILQAQIRALSRQRMNSMRRIADQGKPWQDIITSMHSRQRERSPRSVDFQRPQTLV